MLIYWNVYNVTSSQFHQRYTRAFFVRIFQQSQNVTRKTRFVQKIVRKNVDEIDQRTPWKIVWSEGEQTSLKIGKCRSMYNKALKLEINQINLSCSKLFFLLNLLPKSIIWQRVSELRTRVRWPPSGLGLVSNMNV